MPWIIVKAWLMPLPNLDEEEVNSAIDHNIQGYQTIAEYDKESNLENGKIFT